MENQQKNKEPKHCRECGTEIKEQVESILYECERCIGTYEA